MLIYANQLYLHGNDSEDIVFRAIRRWLKKQTGIQFDQSQLISSGKYDGQRGQLYWASHFKSGLADFWCLLDTNQVHQDRSKLHSLIVQDF